MPDGCPAPALEVRLLEHALHKPVCTGDMVTNLRGSLILSTIKLADTNYGMICNGKEVNVYNGRTTKSTVSGRAVLQGWRCPRTKLWRIPLKEHVTNLNTNTLLLDSLNGQ